MSIDTTYSHSVCTRILQIHSTRLDLKLVMICLYRELLPTL